MLSLQQGPTVSAEENKKVIALYQTNSLDPERIEGNSR